MSHRTPGAHLRRLFSAALTAVEAGFYLPLTLRSARGVLFRGAESLSTLDLALHLAGLVLRLRLRSLPLRQELCQVAAALVVQVRRGAWPLAHETALELAALFRRTARWRYVEAELALRAANSALRVASRCSQEVR